MSANAINDYVKRIDSFKVLNTEEENALIDKMLKGDSCAREALINSNLKLVVKIAHNFKGYGLSLEDLISIGNIGLMNATDKYKQEKGSKFSVYASYWIKSKIKKELSQYCNVIGVCQSTYEKMKKAKALSETKNIDEIAKEMKTRNKQYIYSLVDGLSQCSLDEKISDSEKLTIGDMIEDNKGDFLAKIILEDDFNYIWKKAKSILTKTEYFIIEHRFGLNDKKIMKQTEIAVELNLTNSRVQQIEKNAINKLKICFKST